MHPYPENPDPDSAPVNNYVPSEKAEAIACAVQSLDGKSYCFQAWSNLSHHFTPFPGNACMHLKTFLAETLSPGKGVSVRGIIGIHYGDADSLHRKVAEFFRTNQN